MADSNNELFGLGSHSEDANLKGWWPMQDDAASTVVVDSSIAANNGTLIGGDNTADITGTGPNGYLAKGLHYDGSADTVEASDISLGTGEFTIACWARFDVNSGYQVLIGKDVSSGRDFTFGIGGFTAQRFNFNAFNPSKNIQSNSSLSASTWYHLAVTRNSSNVMAMYIDGVSVPFSYVNSTATPFNSNLNSTGNIFFGSREFSGFRQYADATQAEPVIFNRALTPAEVLQLKSGPEPHNTAIPTLSISSGSWTGTVGSWDSQSNGTVTYAWELRDDSDDSVVESGTGSSPSGSGSYSGDYYLWVRGSNLGGHDSAEDSESIVQTVSASTPTGSGTITAVATISGEGDVGKSGVGSINAVATVAGEGTRVSNGSASINAVGSLSGEGDTNYSGAATVNAVASITGSGTAPTVVGEPGEGGASISAIATINGTGSTIKSGTASINAIAIIAGEGDVDKAGHATINATGAIAGEGRRTASGAASISAVATITGGSSPNSFQPSGYYYHYHLSN